MHIVNFPVPYPTTHLNQISITSNQSTSAPDTPAHDVPNTHGLNSRNDESTVGGSERPADIIRQELVRRVSQCPWFEGPLLILLLPLLSLATNALASPPKKSRYRVLSNSVVDAPRLVSLIIATYRSSSLRLIRKFDRFPLIRLDTPSLTVAVFVLISPNAASLAQELCNHR